MLRIENKFFYNKYSFIFLQSKISKCDKCKEYLVEPSTVSSDISHPLESRSDPMLYRAQERVRELELELAQTKLAHVEAECRNQVIKIINI